MYVYTSNKSCFYILHIKQEQVLISRVLSSVIFDLYSNNHHNNYDRNSKIIIIDTFQISVLSFSP